MRVIFTTGDLLASDARVLVNPVNCRGVMDKGLAKQFREMFPKMYADYRRACSKGKVRPGCLHTYAENGRTIVNLPTQEHWGEPSRIEYIEKGITELAAWTKQTGAKSVAVPKLGCGCGGLAWNDVRPAILDGLQNAPAELVVWLYE